MAAQKKSPPKNAPVSAPPDTDATSTAGGMKGSMAKSGPNANAEQAMSKSTRKKIPSPKPNAGLSGSGKKKGK